MKTNATVDISKPKVIREEPAAPVDISKEEPETPMSPIVPTIEKRNNNRNNKRYKSYSDMYSKNNNEAKGK